MWTLVSFTLIAVGAIISSLEELISHRRTRLALWQSGLRSTFTVVLSVILVLAGATVIASVVVTAKPSSLMVSSSLGLLAVALLVRWLLFQGLDGSDRMLAFAGIGMFVWSSLSPLESVLTTFAWVGLFLITSFAYLESGISKLEQRGWRNGRQLALVLNMKEFGSRPVARILLPHPRLAFVASWGVILLEVSAAPLLLVGGGAAVVAATLLALMHLSIAVLMGLGRFFWPFVGTLCFLVASYPW